MNEKNIQEKIAQLQSDIEKQNKLFHRAAIRTGIIMLLLIVFVFGYTTFLYNKIAELATPQNMAMLLVEQTKAQLPAVRSMIRSQMTPCAEALAEKGLESVTAMIPTLGQYSRNMIAQVADEQLQKIKGELMPRMEEVLDSAVNSAVQAALAEKESGAVSDAIANRVAGTASAELKKILNEEFYASVMDLQGRLNELKNKKELTRRDYSERMAIAAMLRLADEAQDGPVTTFETTADVMKAVMESLKEKIPPM